MMRCKCLLYGIMVGCQGICSGSNGSNFGGLIYSRKMALVKKTCVVALGSTALHVSPRGKRHSTKGQWLRVFCVSKK